MMILGERYDEYMGFDCEQYDPYDPFDPGDADMDAIKSDVAYVLGIEPYSEEWFELMSI